MAINKISQEKINEIKKNSVITLPNKPRISAEELKERFVKPVVDTNNSTVAEINRIVDEVNNDIETANNLLLDHDADELAHADIRGLITTLDGAKVNKVLGKSLISDAEITRLAGVDNYDDTEVRGLITALDADKADVIHTHSNYTTEDAVQTKINTHNSSETAHTGIRNAVAEAKAIAEGKSRARVFATKNALDTWLLDSENVALLQIGDNLYIEETDKPDYWWNGTTIKELETQKVDLTEYAKKTELLTLGTTSNDAYRGDLGQTAYNHSQSAHAPSNAQKNVQSDWNQTDNTKDDYIKNKPTIPTIPDLALNDNTETSGKYISKIEVDSANKHKLNITKKDLPQGFSGDYNDLSNKPTIPTKTSDLTNDSGFITAEDIPSVTIPDVTVNNGSVESGKYISAIAVDGADKHKLNVTKAILPQGFSGSYEDLTNKPSTFPPSTHNHNTLYYQKSETYSKSQTEALIDNAILGLLGGSY